MADRKQPDPRVAANRRKAARKPTNEDDASRVEPTFDAQLDAEELDPGELDTDETDEAGPAAERIASGEALDDDAREELGIDNIVGREEAGIGDGLDEQEEARAGITDEEIEKALRRR